METKNAFGKILLLGEFSPQFLKQLSNKKDVSFCDHLQLSVKKKLGLRIDSKKEIVNIKKLRKKYRDKFFDNIFINYETVDQFDKYWVRDSIFLCQGKIYITNYNQRVIRKYARYNVKITKEESLIVEAGDVKPSFFQKIKHYVQDSIEQLFDYISDFLTM